MKKFLRSCFFTAIVYVFLTISLCYGVSAGLLRNRYVASTFFVARPHAIHHMVSWANKSIKTSPQIAALLGNRSITVSEKFLRHIFAAELKEFITPTGEIVYKLTGFHHANEHYLHQMHIMLINKEMNLHTGVTKADVICNGHIEVNKVFFPFSWNRKKVVRKIGEALNHSIVKPTAESRGNAEFITVIGKTSENIVIKMVIDSAGNLITAFPFFT